MKCRACAVLILGLGMFLLTAGPSLGNLVLVYDGATDVGGGEYLHQYHGERQPGDPINAKDLHLKGSFKFEPGEVIVDGPEGWAASYTIQDDVGWLFHWTVTDEAFEWDVSTPEIYGFSIKVREPRVKDTPFKWTQNVLDPDDIIPNGTGWVPTPVPEPATMSLVILGGLGALIRRRR